MNAKKPFNTAGSKLKAVPVEGYRLEAEGMATVEPLAEALLDAATASNIGILMVMWDKTKEYGEEDDVKFVAALKANFEGKDDIPAPIDVAMSAMMGDDEAVLQYLSLAAGACCPMHYVQYLNLRIEEIEGKIAAQAGDVAEFLKDAPPIVPPFTLADLDPDEGMSMKKLQDALNTLDPKVRMMAIKFMEVNALTTLLKQLKFKAIDEVFGTILTETFFGDTFKNHGKDVRHD